MARNRFLLFIGAGVLALSLIGSIFGPSKSNPVEQPPLPSVSATTEVVQQESPASVVPADEPTEPSSIISNRIDIIEAVDIPGELQNEDLQGAHESNKKEVNQIPPTSNAPSTSTSHSFNLKTVPAYSGSSYTTINENVPYFAEGDLTTNSFESYSKLDNLGRCGVAYACVSQDIMPTEERGPIGMIRPSGWETIRYDDLIEDRYLYNRCHLIGYQLTGENANEQNLITGTRYLNIQGMLPFENQVASYIKNTNNHVMYRITPVFEGDNLLATGVLMEAKSVEDNGDGVSFCVFAYNVQPGIRIDYTTGASERETADEPSKASSETPKVSSEPKPATSPTKTEQLAPEMPSPEIAQKAQNAGDEISYIGNKNTKKFHYPSCSSVSDMKETNKVYFEGTREEVINKGYVPCKRCSP